MKKLILFAMLALAIPFATAAGAYSNRPDDFEVTADGRLVDVQILVDGRTVPLYFGPSGFERRYFQAYRGRNYSLAVTNNTGRRIGVLIAVDGLNVVSGDRSQLASGEAMYVLDPWERTVIRGWRTSLDDIRRFVFVDEQHSYAERTDQANGDMGWIRVLAFNERGWQYRYDRRGNVNGREKPFGDLVPFDSRDEGGAPQAREDAPQAQGREQGAAPQTSREAAPPPSTEGWGSTKSLYRGEAPNAAPGTGWGEAGRDPVRRVWFVPDWSATDHLVFRYEYAAGLRALGIFPRDIRDRIWERERGELGFAQPPRW